ncbi:PKD domain-containing protein [Nocardioides sp. GCM10027113]|uniref:PKD domain-containing protein n=1 Tax=unclassified Nocardioides TaxID=2615069 RepID=UPI00361E76AA
MSLRRSTTLRAATATTALAAALLSGLAPLPTAQAADRPAVPASTLGKRLVTVQFDPQSKTLARGSAFKVTGTASTVTQAVVGQPGEGVAASFTLAVADADGNVLATQEVTAAGDGSFATMVPGSVTRKLPASDRPVSLAVRALDASYGDHAAADAGAGGITIAADAFDLTVENSFVSSVGWVKPGESYPSRIILRNPLLTPVTGAEITVTAPRGTSFESASGPGTASVSARRVTWSPAAVPAGGSSTLVLQSVAATTREEPTIVWRDLSTTAVLETATGSSTVVSHGPKVIPPSESYDSARYGDRPFAVVPVSYTDRGYAAGHDGGKLARKINDPAVAGSTFNLFQEMSLGQLFPQGTVPSDGIATADFESYGGGFDFTHVQPGQTCTGGATFADAPVPAQDSPLYPERITNGVYNLPGNTAYYGADANGSAVVGAVGGVAALQQIDSGCGPTGKLVYDAAAIADPEIDYSDYDTDKDGVVDFFMVVFAGCGGNGSSQLGVCTEEPTDAVPYDNVWPHSSSLEYYYTDPTTGLPGFTTDDQLKDLEGRPLWYTDASRTDMTTTNKGDALKVLVRVGPYNVNPETAIDKASVISHEYGHSLGLPDFYSLGSRDTYGDWNLMATDKSQNMDAYSRQELGWVVPEVLDAGTSRIVSGFADSKEDTGTIRWQTPDGTPYTLRNGVDGLVHNSQMYVAKLPGRQLLDPAAFETGDKATAKHAWFSGSGNDFGCATNGGGHNLDIAIPGLKELPAGSTLRLDLKSMWDIEWDYDYGFVLTSGDGGETFTSHPSLNDYTTSNEGVPGNPNQNACQAAYDNGLTGSSGSYQEGTTATDRVGLTDTPASVFLADSYDISDLVGAASPVLRFSYSTDPGLARPGWFIDDLKVTATTPSGQRILLDTDLEGEGGPDDPRIFNGGCRPDLQQVGCTKGWNFVSAGDEASFDHAYYLEMRDRSGFDLDGRGEIDRDPIDFEPGLYLAYTDEAHGYGNAGTDSPPAQSPLDATPAPGDDTPDLSDAAFTAAAARATYSDSGRGHTDNYSDPRNTEKDPRYEDEPNPWRFRYDCLSFKVLSMSGNDLGPEASDGNLTGRVQFLMGAGCGEFDYGYTPAPDQEPEQPPANTAPRAAATATPQTAVAGESVRLSATGSTDAETPGNLDYSWDFDDGGSTKDAAGAVARAVYDAPGTYDVTVTVTDPQGLTDTATTRVTVTGGGAGSVGSTPEALASVLPAEPFTTTEVLLSGEGSSDAETAEADLVYEWDLGDGGSPVDATGREVRTIFSEPGHRIVKLTVTDGDGNSDTDRMRILVRERTSCASSAVERRGRWRTLDSDEAADGTYCDNGGRGTGRDVMVFSFTGPSLVVGHGRSDTGGRAKVVVDGERVGSLSFRRRQAGMSLGREQQFDGLGAGEHTVRIVVKRGSAFIEGFITRG